MPRTEYKQIGKQLDIEKISGCLNKNGRYTINLTEGFPDDWKSIADHIATQLGRVTCGFIHCLVYNDVRYNCPKLKIVLVGKSSTERPYCTPSYGCIYHTSNEALNGKDVAKSFKLERPAFEEEKKYLWETKRIRIE